QRVRRKRGLAAGEGDRVVLPRSVAQLAVEEPRDAAIDRRVDRRLQIGRRRRRSGRRTEAADDAEAEDLDLRLLRRDADAPDEARVDGSFQDDVLVEDDDERLARAPHLDVEGLAGDDPLRAVRDRREVDAEERTAGDERALLAVEHEAALAEDERGAGVV